MSVRLAETAIPVLGGLIPPTAPTVSSVVVLAGTVVGLAAPVPWGLVGLVGRANTNCTHATSKALLWTAGRMTGLAVESVNLRFRFVNVVVLLLATASGKSSTFSPR